MIICRPSVNITSVTADENPVYPAANLLSARPKLVWRASTGTLTSLAVSLTLTGPVNTVVLLGTVAATAALTWWNGSAWVAPAGLAAEDYAETFGNTVAHWWTFTLMESGTQQFRISLAQTGSSVIGASTLVAGRALTVDGVEYPLQESLVDTSIRAQLLDGSEYYKKRDIYRAFSGTLRADRAATVEPLLRAVCRTYGSVPMAVQIAPTVADAFMVYGRLGMAQASHAWPTVSQASFELVEVV